VLYLPQGVCKQLQRRRRRQQQQQQHQPPLQVLHGTSIGSSIFDEEGAKIVHELMALAASK
jgi:hypothetical protein